MRPVAEDRRLHIDDCWPTRTPFAKSWCCMSVAASRKKSKIFRCWTWWNIINYYMNIIKITFHFSPSAAVIPPQWTFLGRPRCCCCQKHPLEAKLGGWVWVQPCNRILAIQYAASYVCQTSTIIHHWVDVFLFPLSDVFWVHEEKGTLWFSSNLAPECFHVKLPILGCSDEKANPCLPSNWLNGFCVAWWPT